MFADRYRVGFDPAAECEVGGKHDPWYFLVLCKYGDIYPYSDKLLAYHCTGQGIRKKLHRDHPEIEVRNWSDDGEAIFLFPLELFNLIKTYARPRRRRRLSPEQKAKNVERLSAYRFKPKKNAVEVPKSGQGSLFGGG